MALSPEKLGRIVTINCTNSVTLLWTHFSRRLLKLCVQQITEMANIAFRCPGCPTKGSALRWQKPQVLLSKAGSLWEKYACLAIHLSVVLKNRDYGKMKTIYIQKMILTFTPSDQECDLVFLMNLDKIRVTSGVLFISLFLCLHSKLNRDNVYFLLRIIVRNKWTVYCRTLRILSILYSPKILFSKTNYWVHMQVAD